MTVPKLKSTDPDDPGFPLVQFGKLLRHIRTGYIPPLSKERVEELRYGWFLGIKFLEENGYYVGKKIISPEDLEAFELKMGDLTKKGFVFFGTTFQNYWKALDRGTSPEKALKNILEKSYNNVK